MLTFAFSILLAPQQAHWPTHMSTCAQNQSNEDDSSSGAEGNALTSNGAAAAAAAAAGLDAVAGHFINSSVSKSVSSGLGARTSLPVSWNMTRLPAVQTMEQDTH